ncbi:type II toxin-antitoxin system Phd/YefM family antitoxin [Vacuolonema iberomarrocanum]|uniref:type II toxin-antitoxin system Phd/YefM family antitoxin n=1 Tax=Vacuolonema iberomarrocanum TaxID=3454632 RepID=UPI0019EDAAC6|nr:type II toxin-antitoxin system Phd/YefM family antitoxin [filamentous cyanobacterium LEGE 07170]
MDSVSFNQFRDGFQDCVDRVIDQHSPLKVRSDSGSDFVVISAEDWEQLQETLYVLQNSDLMQQIVRSFKTHHAATGYQPSTEEIDEILSL